VADHLGLHGLSFGRFMQAMVSGFPQPVIRLDKITKEEFKDHRHLTRHGNDVPALVTAIKAKPDWLVTANVEHFDEDVALRTGLRIVTPHGFLRQIGIHFRS